MNNKYIVVQLVLLFLSLGSRHIFAASAPVATVGRIVELDQRGKTVTEWINTRRMYRFEEFRVLKNGKVIQPLAGIGKLVSPYIGNFLTQGQVDVLFSDIRTYYKKENGPANHISISIDKGILIIDILR